MDPPDEHTKVSLRGKSWHFPQFGRAAIILRRFGQLIGFAGQDKVGRRSSAENTEASRISWEATGEVPRGEQNTLYVCRTLIEALRAAGDEWAEPVKGQHEPADCESRNSRGERLEIQVVQALLSEPFWQRFARKRASDLQAGTPSELAARLRDPIAKKAAQLAPAIKANLVLALDSTRTTGFTLSTVVDEFRRVHGAWCAEAGFRSVWLVGPFSAMVARLDVRAA